MLQKYNYLKKHIITYFLVIILLSCSTKDKENEETLSKRKWEPSMDARIKQQVEEKGGLLSSKGGNLFAKGEKVGNVSFANANIMWKAILSSLEDISLSQIDYLGGVIITDWYGGSNNFDTNQEIKITIKFLSDQVSVNSIKVISHKKTCIKNNCSIKKNDELFNEAIKERILSNLRTMSIEEKKQK